MNHLPYETWILDGKPGTPEDRNQLRQHLKECGQCAQLQVSWQEAHHQISSLPVQNAPKWFLSNWPNSLILFKEKQKRKQARMLLLSLISGAFIVLIALSAVLLPKISLISMIVTITSVVVRFMESVKQIWSLLLSLMKIAPTTTILVIGAMLAGWILLAVLAWGVSVWKVSVKKVVTK
jgi:hypothetical protein